jgi:hypothetical protein
VTGRKLTKEQQCVRFSGWPNGTFLLFVVTPPAHGGLLTLPAMGNFLEIGL